MNRDRISVRRAGATAARIGGTAVLGGGLLAALLVGGVLVWLFPQGLIGYAVGLLIGLAAAVVGTGLLLGGRRVQAEIQKADEMERESRLVELTRSRGAFTAAEAGRALGMPKAEAEAYLSDLVKSRPDDFSMDLDPSGALVYRAARVPGPRLRVGGEPEMGPEGGLERELEAELQPELQPDFQGAARKARS